MKQLGLLLLLSWVITTPRIVAAEEPTDDTIAQQIMQEAGFKAYSDQGVELAREKLKLKWLAYEERLSRSGVTILKMTEKHDLARGLPETERYSEVMEIGSRLYVRPLPPEEVKRRKMEASGLSPEVMVQGLRFYGEATKQQMIDAMEQALAEIAFAGLEEIVGRPSYHLRIDDVNLVQSLESIAGEWPEAQRADLVQSQGQLEEFEREMASMPADQRAMVEQMMGSQIEQMRSLVNSGTFEVETITTNIQINPYFRDPMFEQFAQEEMTAPATVDPGATLVKTIQLDLTTLGYEPGNTDGVLDTMTQAAYRLKRLART